MSLNLVERVATYCQHHRLLHPADKVVVGVSGGPDSVCLLHILGQLKVNVVVAHLNHQLRGADSEADEAFVQALATAWGLPVFVERQDIANLARARKESIETTARHVRYAFLGQVARHVDATKIAVAHNADDQSETVLMHFLRGAGLDGLRGMQPYTQLDPTMPGLIRPLLEVPREDIEAYCDEAELTPRQDASNWDRAFLRNRIRHELMPILETYNPSIRQTLRRTAKVVTAEVDLFQAHLDEIWLTLVQFEADTYIDFDLTAWLALPLATKRASLRRAAHQLRPHLPDLGFHHIETALQIITAGQTGTQATLPHAMLLTRSYQTLRLQATATPTLADDIPLLRHHTPLPVALPGVTRLPHSEWFLVATHMSTQWSQPASPWEAFLDAEVVGQTLMLRRREPGDIFYPLGLENHHQKLKTFMINEKIPTHYRDYIPLLVADTNIWWVCGYRIDHRARIQPHTRQILHLKFERPARV